MPSRWTGLRGSEDLFAPVWHSARNRSPWLFVNLITAFVATRFIGLFESTIQWPGALADPDADRRHSAATPATRRWRSSSAASLYEQLSQDSSASPAAQGNDRQPVNGLPVGGPARIVLRAVYQRVGLGLVMTAAVC